MASPAPLVLLPGLICSDYVWSRQVADLAGRDVLAIKGYGLADNFPDMARIVLDQVEGPLAVAGHSMGARVALEVFRQAPERIERIALLDTGVHSVQPGEREKRMAWVELGRREGMEALVDTWLPPMVHPGRHADAAFMNPIRQMCIDAGLDTFEAQIHALLGRDDQAPILADIACPALVATGSDDQWSPPGQHAEMAAAMADATLTVFAGAGHFAPLETPDAVSAALVEWLDRPS
jgi:pimeloyl-ACP methyl ester carboxylesterase